MTTPYNPDFAALNAPMNYKGGPTGFAGMSPAMQMAIAMLARAGESMNPNTKPINDLVIDSLAANTASQSLERAPGQPPVPAPTAIAGPTQPAAPAAPLAPTVNYDPFGGDPTGQASLANFGGQAADFLRLGQDPTNDFKVTTDGTKLSLAGSVNQPGQTQASAAASFLGGGVSPFARRLPQGASVVGLRPADIFAMNQARREFETSEQAAALGAYKAETERQRLALPPEKWRLYQLVKSMPEETVAQKAEKRARLIAFGFDDNLVDITLPGGEVIQGPPSVAADIAKHSAGDEQRRATLLQTELSNKKAQADLDRMDNKIPVPYFDDKGNTQWTEAPVDEVLKNYPSAAEMIGLFGWDKYLELAESKASKIVLPPEESSRQRVVGRSKGEFETGQTIGDFFDTARENEILAGTIKGDEMVPGVRKQLEQRALLAAHQRAKALYSDEGTVVFDRDKKTGEFGWFILGKDGKVIRQISTYDRQLTLEDMRELDLR